MPIGPRHKSQKGKNLALLLVLLAIVAMLFVVATLKMQSV